MRSVTCSAAAGWPRSTSAATPASAASSRSSCCAQTWPAIPSSRPGSAARRSRRRLSTTPRSWRSTTPARNRSSTRAAAAVALPYIVMEYVEGRTLRDLLIEGRTDRSSACAVELTAGVLSALEYSHRAGIVHRDIKPANVMLTPDGDVKVMDFGIARALADASATMTQTQSVIGTAQYLSPEQARGETVDARSDLYSAGCLLFELVTGRPPFVADSPVAVAYQHVREAPPRPSDLNPVISDPARPRHPARPGQGPRGALPVRRGVPRRPGEPASGPAGHGSDRRRAPCDHRTRPPPPSSCPTPTPPWGPAAGRRPAR